MRWAVGRLSFVALVSFLTPGLTSTIGNSIEAQTESVSQASADEVRILYFSIQGTLLGIPRNYFKRIPLNAANTPGDALNPASPKQAVIFAILPSMEGQNERNAACFSTGEACDDAVRLTIDGAPFASTDEQSKNILRHAPNGTKLRRVAPDLLILEHPADKNHLQYFGVLENGSMIPFRCWTFVTEQQVQLTNSCRVVMPMTGGITINYYFDPSYANRWRSVYDAVQRLVRSFVIP